MSHPPNWKEPCVEVNIIGHKPHFFWYGGVPLPKMILTFERQENKQPVSSSAQ
jgi:hypothetical protein